MVFNSLRIFHNFVTFHKHVNTSWIISLVFYHQVIKNLKSLEITSFILNIKFGQTENYNKETKLWRT